MQPPAFTHGETESEEVALVLQKGSRGGLELGKKKPVQQQDQTEVCAGVQGGPPRLHRVGDASSVPVDRNLEQLVSKDRQEADMRESRGQGYSAGLLGPEGSTGHVRGSLALQRPDPQPGFS